ncbi:MAG: hypothetical protein Kow0075_12780 [Salibacteraceae bacterium]
MYKYNFLSIVLVSVLTAGCGMLWEYREIRELPKMTWSNDNVLDFEVEIGSDGNYDVIVMFRHVHGFPYPNVPITLTISGDDLSVSEEKIIPVIDEKTRDYLGEGAVDIWDVEFTAIRNLHMRPGKYKVSIAPAFERDELQLVMEVGLMIKASEE